MCLSLINFHITFSYHLQFVPCSKKRRSLQKNGRSVNKHGVRVISSDDDDFILPSSDNKVMDNNMDTGDTMVI